MIGYYVHIHLNTGQYEKHPITICKTQTNRCYIYINFNYYISRLLRW